MIGGTDISLKGHLSKEFLIETFRVNWPNLVYEPGFFIYRDIETKNICDKHGVITEIEDRLISVMWSGKECVEKSTSFVVSNPGSDTYRMLIEIGADISFFTYYEQR